MVPADDDRRAELTVSHHLIEEQSCAVTLTIAEPADASWESLKGDLLTGKGEPFLQPLVFREEIQHGLICFDDVGGISR